MATSTVDGTIEEAVIKRRRAQVSFYDRVKFRLDDGTTKTWTKAHVVNEVSDLLAPGTRGRFYLYTAIDHRGIGGVRTDDGREAFGVSKVNEKIGLVIAIAMPLLLLLEVTVLERMSYLTLALAVLGLPMFLLYRQNRVDAEKAYNADAGFRPAARAA